MRMQTRHVHNDLTWIDLESPSHEDVHAIAKEFNIHPHIAQELLFPSGKPRAEFYGSYAYVILHFPALRRGHTTHEQEVDFLIGKDFIVTAHYEAIDPLHKFSKLFDVGAALTESPIGGHAGFIFFYMIKNLYKASEYEVEQIRHELGHIEESIFSSKHVEMVAAISRTARDLLNLRQTIEPHREVLHELEHEGPKFFGDDFSSNLRSLSNDYYRLHNHVMRETESLHELRETNNSLLTTKQNETMKIFTIMAFVTLPLSLIVETFSMDTLYTPIVGRPYDFWIILCLMGALVTVMFLYFKHKKWL